MHLWRRLAVGASALGALGLAVPTTGAQAAATQGSLPAAQASPHRLATINRHPPASTYVTASYTSVSGGVKLQWFDFHGTQRCNGKTYAILWINGVAFQRTAPRYFNRYAYLAAHFSEHGRFAASGTKLVWRWYGPCAPAGYEDFTVRG